jgi:site-specific DNA-methyltransferase (adenine-specific)
MIDQEKIVDDIMLDELEKKVPGCKEYINNTDNKKKRLGMLSVLGSNYNRDYFEGYRSLIEKEKVCAEYISDIVYTLRNYIGVADTQVKTHGEVMTPLWLVEKMLDTLPKHVWKNPKLKWLDPANGVGTFPSAIVKRLMEGLKDVIPDSCERYQHIVENMIYVCEIQAKNMFLYHCAFDIDDTHKLNTYYGSYLSEGFDHHMKNVWGVEKFDIIIGNPPYNDSRVNMENAQTKDIYPHFIDKSVIICDKFMVMIIPSRWFVKKALSDFRVNMILNYGLKYVGHFDNNLLFNNVDIKGGVSHFLLEKNYNGDVIFNGSVIDLKRYDIIPNDVSSHAFNIIDKVLKCENIQNMFNSKGHFNVKTNDKRLNGSGDVKCLVSKQKGGIKYISDCDFSNTKIGRLKLAIPSASGKGGMNENYYNRIECVGVGEICNESFIFFDFNSTIERDMFKTYMMTKLFSFLVRLRKIKQDVTSDIFKWVPMVSLDREWTDEMIYKHFNLTEEEINHIESIIK